MNTCRLVTKSIAFETKMQKIKMFSNIVIGLPHYNACEVFAFDSHVMSRFMLALATRLSLYMLNR